ncbi:MAG TPA: hypothetical protein P5246_04140 [Candidatus Omnitrophota bacterium]|jgi:hypothetical protein|nr:hypothetical protein [Candidatus Omnitrophota bacterium]HSA30304.1 hypothetical protein [Candidatus Omnitrophota bacterium]
MIKNLLPYILSFALGTLILNLVLNGTRFRMFIRFVLAWGLGLGLSSMIAFSSFWIFNMYSRIYALFFHLVLIFLLGFHQIVIQNKRPSPIKRAELPETGIFILLLLSVGTLSYIYGHFYPFGGWDAWQVWNFKAKFLFESTGQWRNLFDPVLWRSSPHYPLLLPLINVWAWTFAEQTGAAGPFMTSILFNLLTAAIIFAALYELTGSKWAVAAAILPFLNAHYMILATAQYCDHVLGFFLCCAIISFTLAMNNGRSALFGLTGAFLGFLSFTKPEGTIAAGLSLMLFLAMVFFQKRGWKSACWLMGATLVFLIPTLIFKLLLSPGNQTFINGLASAAKPSSWQRLQIIVRYSGMELAHEKWAGLWLVLLAGFFVEIRACFQKQFIPLAAFLILYLGIVLAYYWINTYFEITWWLSVTLGRILISLLPAFLIWIAASNIPRKQ